MNTKETNGIETSKGKGKGKFLHRAVSNPKDCSKRFTLYFPDRPVQSNTISTSLGSIHIFTTIYSQALIYTAERTGAM